MKNASTVLLASLFLAATPLACQKKPTTPPPGNSGSGSHDHDHDGHDHDHDHAHGATVELGEQTSGPFTVRASRDGDVEAGKEAAIDAWITAGALKVSAVRFWIGAEDARGSVKAKADLEKDNWHTHVEVPSPIPDNAKLWIEIEAESGEKAAVSFDLKR